MATNLLIAYPDIGLKATLTSSPATATGYNANNIITGPRSDLWKANATATDHAWIFDLGASTTSSVSYALLDRSPLLYKQSATSIGKVYLYGSTDGISWGSILHTLTSQSSSLVGPQSDITVGTLTTTTAFRYWRANVQASDASTLQAVTGKIYFGTMFDMGREPIAPRMATRSTKQGQPRETANILNLTWEGITNTTVQNFIDKIVKIKDTSVLYLYAPTYTPILFGWTVFPRWLRSCEVSTDWYDRNTTKATFEEAA